MTLLIFFVYGKIDEVEGNGMDVNVFDFDNTIYDGETLVDYILYYVRRDPKIWKYIPKLLVIAFKDHFHLFSVDEAVTAYASFLEGYYIKVGNVAEYIEEFWDKNEHKIKPWYDTVRQDSDIIVSGTTDFILDEIMKRIGVKHYVGSSIDSIGCNFRGMSPIFRIFNLKMEQVLINILINLSNNRILSGRTGNRIDNKNNSLLFAHSKKGK